MWDFFLCQTMSISGVQEDVVRRRQCGDFFVPVESLHFVTSSLVAGTVEALTLVS